jgi:hypothetical protein
LLVRGSKIDVTISERARAAAANLQRLRASEERGKCRREDREA